MLDKIPLTRLLPKKPVSAIDGPAPKHIAITVAGISSHAKREKVEVAEAYRLIFDKVRELVQAAVRQDIPIITFSLVPARSLRDPLFEAIIGPMKDFFEAVPKEPLFHDNQVRITVLGKWYGMPSKVIEPIKRAVDATKDYDRFFCNFCINYDGQEEIVDACRILARKVQAERLGIDGITKEQVKDALYSSYFLPPSGIIVTGGERSLGGFLLWDASEARIAFTEKSFLALAPGDLQSL
ncbi:undecaprenyl diphosphate synthase family protein [Candidatus Woesearchaeota archaeon]|nr:undecaprenyl diphosphate synthase family protein [Candidatus Woesearchaeota archaeon]